jgi:hypothetical protein
MIMLRADSFCLAGTNLGLLGHNAENQGLVIELFML